jgi:ribonuclease HII
MVGQQSKQEKIEVAMEKEHRRFQSMCAYEAAAYEKGAQLIAGIDEAGRGPLAGPVVAACVILPRDIFIKGLNDSKKLTSAWRDILFEEIREKAVAFGIGMSDEKCIDRINILNATKLAMKAAVDSINLLPDLLLIDAVKLEDMTIEQIAIIKGDTLSVSIAAASIIAKVTRDRLIDEFDLQYPVYGFKQHKGYGTEQHINAIKKYGICPIHRISFTKKFVGGYYAD